MELTNNRISLTGYDLLGNGDDGIRYAWRIKDRKELLESAAFIYKTKGQQSNVSGYTASVSLGCILRQMGYACRFCRTGMLLPYRLHLTAEEIALQNVLMVLTDMHCDDHKELAEREREFAYMGQGEPGYSYPQVRKAIRITDEAMKRLHQTTYRHIFATSGVRESMEAFTEDLENGFYASRVTLHFSLHSLVDRAAVMPIDEAYPVKTLIPIMERISRAGGEKVSLGFLLFQQFKPKGLSKVVIDSKVADVRRLCHIFNSEYFRFSLCEFNDTEELGETERYSSQKAQEMLYYLKSEGYDAKLFYSYGQEKNTACGMLAGKSPDRAISGKWKMLEEQANELVTECSNSISL